jgi:hypothetical protein
VEEALGTPLFQRLPLCADPQAATRHPDADAAQPSSRPKSARQRIPGEREDDDEGRDVALKTSFAAAFGVIWQKFSTPCPMSKPRSRIQRGRGEVAPILRKIRVRRGDRDDSAAHHPRFGSGVVGEVHAAWLLMLEKRACLLHVKSQCGAVYPKQFGVGTQRRERKRWLGASRKNNVGLRWRMPEKKVIIP